MSPLPLQKRYNSDSCSYYDTSCGTHRLAVMIIIICVGLLVTGILSYLFVRSRSSKAAKERARLMQHQRKLNDPFVGMPGPYPASHARVVRNDGDVVREMERQGTAPPPPYTPRRPERVAYASWR